jgi:hypothetical protein
MTEGFKGEFRDECNLIPFLRTLSPGVGVVLQYDCRPPAFGVFQGFQCGFVLLSNFNGFPGLVRIAACRINAVSPFSCCFPVREERCEDFDDFGRCGFGKRFGDFDDLFLGRKRGFDLF